MLAAKLHEFYALNVAQAEPEQDAEPTLTRPTRRATKAKKS